MDAPDKTEQLLFVLCTICMRSPCLGVFLISKLLNVVIIPQKHIQIKSSKKPSSIAHNYICNYSKYYAFFILRNTEGSPVPGAIPMRFFFPTRL